MPELGELFARIAEAQACLDETDKALRAVRAALLRHLNTTGMTHDALAEELGVTRQRVGQLIAEAEAERNAKA